MQSLKCPTCGKEGFKDERSLATHMGMAHKDTDEQKALFWIRIPVSEKKIWEEKATKEGMNLTQFLRHIMSGDDRVESVKIQLQQDYQNKITTLEDENTKLKEFRDTLIQQLRNITGKQKGSKSKELTRLNKIVKRYNELGYDDNFLNSLYEESVENDALQQKWEALNSKQQNDVRKLVDFKKFSLPEALKRVSR